MPSFSYTALDQSGRPAQGTITAAGRAAAMRLLDEKGLHPTELAELEPGQQARKRSLGLLPGKDRVPKAAVESFTRELANLLTAGVSLSRALQILGKEASHPAARKQWSQVRDDVMDGMSLADAAARLPGTFSQVNIAMIRAGEAGGFLDVVLSQIADFRARERDLAGKVKAAMVYPVILSVLMVLVVVFLLTYFIPRFTGIFEDFGSSLPALTQVIVAASDLILNYGLFVLVGVVLVAVVVKRAADTPGGKRHLEQLMLKTPGLGMVTARLALVRFCRMLGTLVGSGVPLVTALRVAREAIGNQTLSDAVASATEQVKAGEGLAKSLAACPMLFPASVVEMVTVAEETGRLDQELTRLSFSYEQDLDRQLRMLVAAIEPLLLFVMAAVVGTIVVGMLLPVFTLQDLIR